MRPKNLRAQLVNLETLSISKQDEVSQLYYDHGGFFGVALPSIEHSHVDSSTTTSAGISAPDKEDKFSRQPVGLVCRSVQAEGLKVYQSQCDVRPLCSHRHDGSVHLTETLRIPPCKRIGRTDRQPSPAWWFSRSDRSTCCCLALFCQRIADADLMVVCDNDTRWNSAYNIASDVGYWKRVCSSGCVRSMVRSWA